MSSSADAVNAPRAGVLRTLRRLLLGVLVLGVVGTGVELLLIEHTEEFWQWVPLILFGICLMAVGGHLAIPGPTGVRVLRVVMVLFVVSGVIGLFQHYQGNAEFELEMYPSLAGLALFWESIRGATPALAPGTMVQLGLLGLVYTFRHPQLRGASPATADRQGE